MRSILSTLLFISGIAGAACWSQTPYNERTDDLGAFHGANLCWDTDGRFDVATTVCTCPMGEEYDAVEGCRVPPPTQTCGDPFVIEGDEVCDGPNLDGESCESLEFAGGVLACAADCQTFDTSECFVAEPPPPAGEVVILASSSGSEGSSSTTTHPIQIPSGNVGETIVVLFTNDGGDVATPSAGWTEFYATTTGNRQRGWWRVADGSDSLTVTTPTGEQSAHFVLRLSGGEPTATIAEAPATVGQPDPPPHTANGEVWVATWGYSSGGDISASAYPAGYDDNQININTGTGNNAVHFAVATKTAALALDDPSPFSVTFDSSSWTAVTIAIGGDVVTPPPPPPPPPGGGTYDLLATMLPTPGEMVQLLDLNPIAVLFDDGSPECAFMRCDKADESFSAWTGMAFDETGGKWWSIAGGGHSANGGNEIYEFDFATMSWGRLTDPSYLDPVTAMPLSGPAATHTYDGSLYVPSTGELFLMSGHAFETNDKIGFWTFKDGTWALVLPDRNWSDPPSSAPPEAIGGAYWRSAYDAARDRVYAFPLGGPVREFDPQNGYAHGVIGDIVNDGSTGTALFEPVSRYLYSFNRSSIRRAHIALDGTFGEAEQVVNWSEQIALGTVPAGWAADPTRFKNGVGTAAAWHPPSQTFVIWDGGHGLVRVDPDSGVVTNISVPDNAGTQTNTIYSKWIYVDEVDAFVGILSASSAGRGLWLYRLPDAPVPPEPMPEPEPEPEPEPDPGPSNFDARANAPGVVFADPLDTEAAWWVDANGAKHPFLNPDGTEGIPTESWWRESRGVSCKASAGCVNKPQLDANVKASGSGSLRFEYQDESKGGGGGVYATNMSGDLSIGFGEGEAFYVQYRIRHSCDALYFDCEPRSPTYRTQRRYFSMGGGGATSMKNLIIADGDAALGESADACTWMQIVVTHGRDHSLVGFHSCGWYAGFSEDTGEQFGGSKQYDSQAGGYALDADGNKILGLNDDVFPTCWRMPDAPASTKYAWGFTGPDCWQFEADEWATIQVRVEVGTWQPERTGEPNSRVTIWAAHEGEPQTRIVDRKLYLRGPNPKFLTSEDYGKIWFLPHMTGKDSTEQHPTFNIWYDELIVSTEFIADPR